MFAFCEWGESCVERFNGMWTFAIWDKQTKQLFISRDRFGVKPLFYAELRMVALRFASEMKVILPLGGSKQADVRPLLCRQSL